MRPKTSSLLAFLLFAASTLCFGANTWTVTSTADDGSAGTLRWAVGQSQIGDTILFNLTYPATIALSNFDLVINHSLTITGPGSSKLTIDSTNNHNGYRAFSVTSGTVLISGLKLTGGRGKASDSTTDGEGGAIYNAATLSLNDVTVSSNKVGAQGNGGGGIYNSGTLTLTGCTVTGNQAGATTFQFDQSNNPIVVRGGGIQNRGSLTVSNSTISNNFAHEGGGIWTNGTQFSVSGSTFSGNQAGVGVSTTLNLEGGGIYLKSTQANSTVSNSTFVNNQGKIYGGAMTIWPGGQFSVSVSDSTFSGNTAPGGGGAGGAFSVENGTLIVKNNLLYDPDECHFGNGVLTSLGYNLASDSTCNLTGTNDQQNTAAGLDPAGLQNNGGPTQTVALLSSSPAVDTGSCTDAAGNTVSTDQRGVARPEGTTCDIGAFELDQSSSLVVTNTSDSGPGSLRQAISDANSDANPSDTITFSLTYPATITLTSGVLSIDKNLTIRGPGASNLAISGGSSSSCIINSNGTKECTPPSGGSQIFDIVSGVTASITGVTLENGDNDNGGAVVNYGTLTLGDCVVTQNQSIQGAALNNQSTGTLVLSNCTVSNNTASGIGGGLINFGTATITASTFSSNTALEAGGVFSNGTLTIVNSTFAQNQGNTAVGAIESVGTTHLSNSTLYNNSSPSIGGLFNNQGTLTIKGTLLSKGSVGDNCAVYQGSISSEGGNLSDDTSCTTSFSAPSDLNNIPASLDPNGLQDNGGSTKTVALLANSAAVDAIPPDSCTDADGNAISVDQRGVTRPQGNGCDIGAFELKQTATTTSIASSSNPSTYGQSVTFTATVQSGSGTPSGSVTFYDGQNSLGTATLTSGQASLTTAALTGGQHTVTATFAGGGGFASSTSAPVNQTVNAASTSTAISSSANPSNYGDSVSFTATVSSTVAGTQTGTVTFYDGTTSLGSMPLSSGQAVLSTSSLTGGQHSVTATYSGDANFANSTSTAVTQTVNRASTTTSVISATNPSIYGQPVSFTATVSSTAGTPTGSVYFFDGLFHAISGSISLINGQATFTAIYPPLAVGSHTIYAQYGGGTNFVTSLSSGLSQTVTKAGTTTSLNANPNPATTSQTITLSASVQTQYGVPQGGGSASGTVTFMDGQNKVLGTATLLNGSTALQLTLGQGSHNLTAVYGGDSNNTGSTSPVVVEAVTAPQPSSTTISSSLNPSYVGQSVTFTAAVTPPLATGTVTFMQGQNTLGTRVLNAGQASFTTSTLPAGNLLIVAVYGGDGQYAGSTSASLAQTVNKGTTATSIVSFPNPSIIGQPVTFVAHVTVTSPNGGTPSGMVAFVKGSTVMGTVPLDSTGTAKFPTSSLSLGNNNVKAVYGGSPAYLGSRSAAITQVVNF